MKHPYTKYESSKLWEIVKSSIEELVENNDIELQTPIEYVVGYICKNISVTNISEEMNNDTNIFACYISYPSLSADEPEQTKAEAINKGDTFRSYIWGEHGLDQFLKKLPYADYGQDIKRILFQFYVLPCDYERVHIKTIETYRKKEKSIGVSIIIENDFFSLTDIQRRCFLASSIISVLERLKEIIEKKKLDTKSSQLVLDLKQELNNYVGR